jgi:hypothetical protein
VLALGAQLAWLGVSTDSTRAASVTVNLDQWATLDAAWQNGNLNGNNSRYPEGGVVPFRLAIEGLSVGNHEITISHDFTAGGHKAYDFLTTWNATNATGTICQPSGGAISSMCPSMPSPSSKLLPLDPFIVDGLSVAAAQAYAGMSRRLTIWGGSILAIGLPNHSGPVGGNSEVEFIVRFRATGSAVLLAWGGHLAQSSYWNALVGGEPDGASLVSGAPWHVRTRGLDGGGGKNQDRSIQPSAIVGALPPFGPAPTPPGGPTPPPAGPTRTSAPRPPGVAGPVPTPPNTAGGAQSLDPSPDPVRLSAILLVWALCFAVAIRPISQRRRR